MADEFFATWTNDPDASRSGAGPPQQPKAPSADLRGAVVLLWAFAPATATLLEKLTMLRGEPIANPMLTGMVALAWLGAGPILMIVALFGGPGRFARALAVVGWALAGILTSAALHYARSDVYNEWLVALRFDLSSIRPDETYREIVQGGVFYGTGAFVRVLEVHDDGSAEIEWDGERLTVPDHADYGRLTRYAHPHIWTCPAPDGWWYVHHWDT